MLEIQENNLWLTDIINSLLHSLSIPASEFKIADFIIRGMLIVVLAMAVHYGLKFIILKYLVKFIHSTRMVIDDFFLKRKVIHRLVHLLPALVIYQLTPVLMQSYPFVKESLIKLSVIYMIAMLFAALQGFFRVLEDIYNTKPYAAERPIKSYIQLLSLISFLVAGLIIISYIFDIQVTRILAGMGAMAAVLLLIFKDTILGLVAGVQLSANKMVKVGDWISMPAYNADGTVLEITLNTVKVQNWDQTITTVPTYALVASPFINWRGMEESGGRRIKRSVNIDMRSVTFCTPELLEKLKKIQHLKDYIETRQAEIDEYNRSLGIDESVKVNGRRMTNLGVFRKYLENYCRQHPKLNTDMTLLIRHLQPSEKGIPIEIYAFSNEKAWALYEEIQSDIFDHILAVIPEFELSVFQLPSGNDLKYINQPNK